MTERQQISQMSTKSILLTTVSSLIIGTPLILLMSFTFLSTMTLLLVTFPLFVIFSPLIFGAFFVFGFAVTGFVVAVGMAVVGVTMVGRVVRPIASKGVDVIGSKFVELSSEKGADWGGYLHWKEVVASP